MQATSCFNEHSATPPCLHGCYSMPFMAFQDPPNQTKPSSSSIAKTTTTSICRHTFAATTVSSFFRDQIFTNHESLPSLHESYSQFTSIYPTYINSSPLDEIRSREYSHLTFSNHVCLDYIGIGLFSYSQLEKQLQQTVAASSSSVPPPPPPRGRRLDCPLFGVSHKLVNFKSELLHGGPASELECAIKRRIMDFLNISVNDYSIVLTTNRSLAFKLVSESYPFRSSKKLLTAYDYQSEAVESMVRASETRGAKVMSAEFKWPRLRINSERLRNIIVNKSRNKNKNSRKKKNRGLFVFPLQSRVTGGNYSYQWMTLAQENGWHILLDACALGPKDMGSFGLSIIKPDFFICSFYKVFGENPTGFGCLLVKKSAIPILEDSGCTGIINLIPPRNLHPINEDSSGTDMELIPDVSDQKPIEEDVEEEAECRNLDHIETIGLSLIGSRARFLINWLTNALIKLNHPNAEKKLPLVRIYGPNVKFDRGPALAFNIYDWKGEKIEPFLVQKLADRNNISLSYAVLHHIWFPDEKERVMMEKGVSGNLKKQEENVINVITIALGFLSNFEDVYKVWAFVARFLDADFVEKERWRYTALNQKTIEL